MQFKTDATGKPLKYKIVVKECRVFAVLYNDEAKNKQVKEIPFKEIVIPDVSDNCKYISKETNSANPKFFG